jgi:hypothetical protein
VQRYKENLFPAIVFPRLVTSFPTTRDLSLKESVECNLPIASSLLFTSLPFPARKGKKVKGKVVKSLESENTSV